MATPGAALSSPITTAAPTPLSPPPPPSIFQRLLLYADTDDLSSGNQRRLVVSVAACLGCLHPFAFCFYSAYLVHADATDAAACALTGFILTFVTWVTVYCIAMVQGDVSETLFDCWLLGTNAALPFYLVSLPQYPCVTWVCLVIGLALVCGTPRTPLHIAMSVGVYVVKEYNEASIGTANGAFASGARFQPFAESLVHRMLGTIVLGAFVAVLAAFVKQHQRRVARADATVVFVHTMSEYLAHYDTDTVKKAIALELAQGAVDAGLLAALDVLTNNLDRYRPHLPDWVLEAVKREGEAAAAAAGSGQTAPGGGGTTVEGGADEDEVDPDMESFRNSQLASDVSDLSMSTPTHQQGTPLTPATPASSGGGGGDGSIRVVGSGRAMTNSSDGSPMVKDASRRYGGAFDRSVAPRMRAAAPVKLGIVNLFVCPLPTMTTFDKSTMDNFLGEVMTNAKATQGSLHSFIGDTVVLTWNATHTIVQPEVKLCTFLAKIRTQSVQKAWPINLSGAGITCTGRARFAGPPTGQRTLHVSIGEQDARALRTLTTLAAAALSYLVDSATANASSHLIVSREVEAFVLDSKYAAPLQDVDRMADASAVSDLFVRQSPQAAPVSEAASGIPVLDFHPLQLEDDHDKTVIASEIVAELGESSDEWMYVMKANDNATKREALVSQSLRLCLKGSFAEALQRLDEATFEGASSMSTAALIRRLRNRIEGTMAITGRRQGNASAFAIHIPYTDIAITSGF